jgi:ATP-binding cassette, subfamily G (WHITE), member 2, SNQ2
VPGPNQICTLFGAQPGQSTVKGADYLSKGYSYHTADLWRRNFVVLIGWILFFQLAQIVAVEYFQPVSASLSHLIFARPKRNITKSNEKSETLKNKEMPKTDRTP